MKHVSDVLRGAMVDAERRGVSLYRMAKQCELDDSIVYRFYHDQCGLALSSVDRLAEFLHLELRPKEPKGNRAARNAGLSVLAAPAKGTRKKRATATPVEVKKVKKSKKSAKKKGARKKTKKRKTARAR